MFWAEKKRFILLFWWLLLSYEYRRETDISFCKQHNEVHTILLVHYLLNKFTIFSNLKRIKFLSHFASCFVLSNFKWKKNFLVLILVSCLKVGLSRIEIKSYVQSHFHSLHLNYFQILYLCSFWGQRLVIIVMQYTLNFIIHIAYAQQPFFNYIYLKRKER